EKAKQLTAEAFRHFPDGGCAVSMPVKRPIKLQSGGRQVSVYLEEVTARLRGISGRATTLGRQFQKCRNSRRCEPTHIIEAKLRLGKGCEALFSPVSRRRKLRVDSPHVGRRLPPQPP